MKCKIIRDLLPLYHDEVASDESRELVEDHLKTCTQCREILDGIHESVSIKSDPHVEQPMASSFRTLKKRLHRKTVTKIAISVICAVTVVSALIYGMFFYETTASYSEVTRTITQPLNSAVDFIMNLRGHKSISVSLIGDALYISCSDTFWTRYFLKPDSQLQLDIPSPPTATTAPIAPIAPIAPLVPGLGIPEVPEPPEPPEPPEAPNILTLVNEVTRIFYFEGKISELSRNNADMSKAVLIWERP